MYIYIIKNVVTFYILYKFYVIQTSIVIIISIPEYQ